LEISSGALSANANNADVAVIAKSYSVSTHSSLLAMMAMSALLAFALMHKQNRRPLRRLWEP
jgi:hypothetical protein